MPDLLIVTAILLCGLILGYNLDSWHKTLRNWFIPWMQGKMPGYRKISLDLSGEEALFCVAMVDKQGRLMFQSGETANSLQIYPPVLIKQAGKALSTGEEQFGTLTVCPIGHKIKITVRRLTNEDGELLGAVGIAVDISILEKIQEQIRRIEKLVAVDEVAAATIHEIKNPLTAIRATAQLAMMVEDQEEKNRHLAQIIKEIDCLNHLLRELVNFARPDGGNYTPHDIREVLDGVLTLAGNTAKASNVTVAKDYYQGEMPLIRGERSLLRQAFLNLVTNAIEAISARGEVRVSCYPLPEEGVVRVAIQDNGAGIAPENIHRIMTPFFTTKERGSGLGLAVTRQIIVERHEGRFWLESELQEGTTAYVDLPVVKP